MELTRAIRFATLLHSYRAATGLTQEELAERAGLSVRAISDLERGVRGRPQRETLALLAQALALSTEQRALFEAVGRGRPLPASIADDSSELMRQPMALPDGTITVLCSEIVDSAYRWEQQPQAMLVAAARHDILLKECIAAHHGVVAHGGEGDRLLALFARPRDALIAACAVQQALAAEPWLAAVGPLQVRIALHSGDAGAWDGRAYRGATVSRAARLRAVAHGGQILLSATTYELVRDDLPDEVTLRDLGEHRLADLTRPERIIQVLLPGLPADFPPLHALDAQHHNLPMQPTALIGRERAIAAVRARLLDPDVRLLTLTGTGGTGKTRLALQVAAEALDAFPDGVYFVDLAPITEGDLVLPAIAQALHVTEAGGSSLREALHAFLAEKRLLLILDNFEQLVDAAPVVADLLAATAQMQVLATSRAALRLRAEHVYAVPPLALPTLTPLPPLDCLAQYEAVRLFVERAVAVQSSFTLTAENALAVASICIRLDGLPLAVELAAARVRLFTPQALLVRLADRLGTLTNGAPDLPERQRTLRATIDWSYGLLTAQEQALFTRMSVFLGGGTLEAIDAVCNLDGTLNTLEGVDALLAQSLLIETTPRDPEEEPRFTMLPTIREYGLAHVEQYGDGATLWWRYASYYRALVDTAEPALIGPEQAMWLTRLEREHDNLRGVLTWACEKREVALGLHVAATLQTFWEERGFATEGRRWLHALLAIDTADHPDYLMVRRAHALEAAGILAIIQHDFRHAGVLVEESLGLFQTLLDRDAIMRCYSHLGAVAAAQDAYGQATDLFRHALDRAQHVTQKSPTKTWRAMTYALLSLGKIAFWQGDNAEAAFRYQAVLAQCHERGDKAGMMDALNQLGALACSRGDWVRAMQYGEEGQAIADDLSSIHGRAAALSILGQVAYVQGDAERSLRLCEEHLALRLQLGERLNIAAALLALGRIRHVRGEEETARELYAESVSILQESASMRTLSMVLEGVAELACAHRQFERTARLYGAAATLREAAGISHGSLERMACERDMITLRAHLGEDTIATLWRVGQAMSVEQALSEARAAIAPL